MDRIRALKHPPEDGLGTSLADFKMPDAPKHGDRWGRWVLNGDGQNWTLDLTDIGETGSEYYIPLYSIHESSQLLDWIIQLADKTFVSTEDIGCLVLALDEIFMTQATLCGSGASKRLEPGFLDQRLGPHPRSA
jgi:hypothetical protein